MSWSSRACGSSTIRSSRIMFPARGRAASYDVKGTPPSPRRRLGPHPATHRPDTRLKSDGRDRPDRPKHPSNTLIVTSAGKPFVGDSKVRDVVYKTIVVHMPVHVPGRAPSHRRPVHDRAARRSRHGGVPEHPAQIQQVPRAMPSCTSTETAPTSAASPRRAKALSRDPPGVPRRRSGAILIFGE